MLKVGMHIHLIGIGGAGLSALARVLQGSGYRVSGSDACQSEITDSLQVEGIEVFIGHRAEQVNGADIVLPSSAIPADNSELTEARERGIRIIKRSELLHELMLGRTGIAVAGTHGKTTTTAMLASILVAAERDPSFIVGGTLAELGTNARAGEGDVFLVEADEYDRMFLGLEPDAAVLTVVEHDHPDCYPDYAATSDAFREFVHRLPEQGVLVACWDDPGARAIGQDWVNDGGIVRWYGLSKSVEWRATDLRPNQAGGMDFVISHQGATVGLIRMRLPGKHNVMNALAAVAVTDWLNIPFEITRMTLTGFRGVGRRYEVKGKVSGVTVIDDYAHHPTEVMATLAAAREQNPNSHIWAVFQPHTYSRTRAMLNEFAASFGDADTAIVLDIYAARETNDFGVSSSELVDQMRHDNALHIPGRRDAADYIAAHANPGDVVITMGAGDGYMVGEWVIQALRNESYIEGVS
ncbi:MAG: UDP-N-acetylmuramate--L-alanine ligase [Chloroflexota bacterium]